MVRVEDAIDRLYGLALEEFVAERDALAKRLRADRHREEADRVKGLRKPSVAAWAINQALRSRPDDQRALLAAGDALRAAQEDLLSGRSDAAKARKATEAEREAVGRLVSAARGLAREQGFLSDTVLDRVRETLHAAATDDEARAEVAQARVARERRPAAFGGVEGFAATAPPTPSRSRTKRTDAQERGTAEPARARKHDAQERADEKERKAQERAGEKERKAQEQARRRALKAALRDARKDERDAGRRRREAEKALGGAQAELEAAQADERAAADRRDEAEDALED